jgi:hypothetical protein
VGDFENGTLEQWNTWDLPKDANGRPAADRLTVVPPPGPAPPGSTQALRVLLRDGDVGFGQKGTGSPQGSGWRAEVVKSDPPEIEGIEAEYTWSTWFDRNYPGTPRVWQVFTQWHQCGECENSGGSPPIEFVIDGGSIQFHVRRTDNSLAVDRRVAALVRESWNHFRMRVKWSTSEQDGYVEVSHNGQVVIPRQAVATMYPAQNPTTAPASVYLKMGLYRQPVADMTDWIVFHDEMKRTCL